MRERVEQWAGQLIVASSRAKGTKVVVELPYNHESMLVTSKKNLFANQ